MAGPGPGSGGPVYFAWVDSTATTFSTGTHCVEDEDVWSFELTHDEGQIPTCEVEITNPCVGAPYVGLLASSRKQWAWISVWDYETSTVKPLIFGRIVGIPSDLSQKFIKVLFVARADDYLTRQQTLADSLKVRPYYDPIFFDDRSRNDPSAIIEGYAAAYHVNRTTLAWTISDILEGEDGTITIGQDDILSDLSFTVKETPLRAVRADATVTWSQNFRNTIIPVNSAVTKTFTGGALISSWPKVNDDLGGGWKAASGTAAVDLDGTEFATAYQESGSFQDTNTTHATGDVISASWNASIPPAGLKVNFTGQANYATVGSTGGDSGKGFGQGALTGASQGAGASGDDTSVSVQSQWQTVIPWRVATSLYITPDGNANAFTETLTFTLAADIQPVITDATTQADAEVIEFQSVDVGEAYIDVQAWSTLKTAGGSVTLGQVMVPNIPTGSPGGFSFQVAVVAGTMGSSSPSFSDTVGAVTTDGSVSWACLGSSLPTISGWQASTFIRKGTLICVHENSGYFYLCTDDGYTGQSAPTFNSTAGATTTDNGVVWTSLATGGPSLIVPIGGQPGNVTQSDFFGSDRGARAVEFMISKCRARMLTRARAIEIGCEIPFADGLDLSLRKSAEINHKYLPGGSAQGKIISYSLSSNGDTGERKCSIRIGCACGRGGTVVDDAGEDDYSDAIEHDAQTQTGKLVSLGDVAYEPPLPDETYNGFHAPLSADQAVLLATWHGSYATQMNAINRGFGPNGSTTPNPGVGWGYKVEQKAQKAQSVQSYVDTLMKEPANSVYFELHLRPISGNEVTTPYNVTVSNLVIPQQIDLEAEPV